MAVDGNFLTWLLIARDEYFVNFMKFLMNELMKFVIQDTACYEK